MTLVKGIHPGVDLKHWSKQWRKIAMWIHINPEFPGMFQLCFNEMQFHEGVRRKDVMQLRCGSRYGRIAHPGEGEIVNCAFCLEEAKLAPSPAHDALPIVKGSPFKVIT